MTLGSQTTYAERRARVDSASMTETDTSDVTKTYINEGVREFCKITGGIPKEEYLALTPKFDLRTNFAIRLTITGGANAQTVTDLVLAATAQTDITGASAATYITEQISNNLAISATMSWDTASWNFTLSDGVSAATYLEVGAPAQRTYVDWTYPIFNKSGTQSGTYFEGSLPLDSTVEVDLPSDFSEIEYVEWDGVELYPAPYDLFISPGSEGTPRWYAIKNKKLRLAPYPSSQEALHIRYKNFPADLETDGTSDATECLLPTQTHWAPVHYAASMIAGENQDDKIMGREFSLFRSIALEYKARESNQNPALFPIGASYIPIDVVIPD